MKLHINMERKPRVEMLPLIDIVFLLLVFFIYAMLSMAVHRGLNVDLPVSAQADTHKKLVISVTIKSDGTVFVDEAPAGLEMLDDILKKKAKGYGEKGVLLFADRNIPYQTVFKVIDRIKASGISRISLQADEEK
jgi:biopolymer transport protein ExbD